MSRSTISYPLGFVNSILDVLFRVIPIILQAQPADRYERAMSVVLPNEDDFKQTCRAKLISLFPQLELQFLDRLVLASLWRRRFFHYAASYSLKFQSDIDQELPVTERPTSPLTPTQFIADEETPTAVPCYPSNLSEPTFDEMDLGDTSSFESRAHLDLDPFDQPSEVSNDTTSMRSMAMSHQETRYSIPPFPVDSEGELRECVACHLVLPFPTEESWSTHILRDIRPYVCTFPECSFDPNKLYSSRRAWFQHEITFHRRRWPCPPGCPPIITDPVSFQEHIASEYRRHTYEPSSNPLKRGQEIPTNADIECPFCRAVIKPPQQVESHVAFHHIQVSLMVLQSSIVEDSDDEVLSEASEEDLLNSSVFPTTDQPVASNTKAIGPQATPNSIGEVNEDGSLGHGKQLPIPKQESQLSKEKEKAEKQEKRKSIAFAEEPDTLGAADRIIERSYLETHLPNRPHAGIRRGVEYSGQIGVVSKPSKIGLSMSGIPSRPKLRAERCNIWFLMSNLGFHFGLNSPIRLGQLLADPHNPAEGLLSQNDLSSIMSREHTYRNELKNATEHTIDGIDIVAERLTTNLFHPSTQDYLSVVVNRPEVTRIFKEESWTGPRRVFFITGLRVAVNYTMVRKQKDSSLSISSPGASIGPSHISETQMETSGEHAVILAYSLAQVRQSFLGSFAVSRHSKGASF
ncbi:hypothetical protein F5Y10DRAFT_272165 [Nemania abortiva]|nr:hypothetical protein F5Y10DRAFT_272165 [Nemania abortiva]